MPLTTIPFATLEGKNLWDLMRNWQTLFLNVFQQAKNCKDNPTHENAMNLWRALRQAENYFDGLAAGGFTAATVGTHLNTFLRLPQDYSVYEPTYNDIRAKIKAPGGIQEWLETNVVPMQPSPDASGTLIYAPIPNQTELVTLINNLAADVDFTGSNLGW